MDILHANDYMMAQTHIRLFHRLFYKVSLFYVANVPRSARRILNKIMVVQALSCLFLLLYVHRTFLSSPGTCLDYLTESLPIDGIVRVQINTSKSFYSLPLDREILYEDEEYIMEYSVHHAFLRMGEHLRTSLNISVTNMTVQKDDPCFGNFFSRFLLDNLFGYDDVLMGSFRNVASTTSNKGFLRNVITGEHYRFVDIWINKLNYVFSFLLMIILTSVTAMLMRLCHHQLFKFFCKLLFALQQNQVLYPVWMPFPIASLLTMFLGLWGLETIMTELLDDPMVSFHLIAFVWMADNYYTICCHSYLSRKYFPLFFYLSSYLFYAFHNQFNGQFSGLALVTTFATTQLCMIYCYHQYELPIIELFVSRSRREGGGQQHSNPLTVEAMVTSLVQLQQNGYGSLEPYIIPNLERGEFDLSWLAYYQGLLRRRWELLWRHISQNRRVSRYLRLSRFQGNYPDGVAARPVHAVVENVPESEDNQQVQSDHLSTSNGHQSTSEEQQATSDGQQATSGNHESTSGSVQATSDGIQATSESLQVTSEGLQATSEGLQSTPRVSGTHTSTRHLLTGRSNLSGNSIRPNTYIAARFRLSEALRRRGVSSSSLSQHFINIPEPQPVVGVGIAENLEIPPPPSDDID